MYSKNSNTHDTRQPLDFQQIKLNHAVNCGERKHHILFRKHKPQRAYGVGNNSKERNLILLGAVFPNYTSDTSQIKRLNTISEL